MKLKKILLTFALLLIIVPCVTLLSACGEQKSYTVTFVDYNDSVINVQSVKEGESAERPANPTRDGYSFIGWDITFNEVRANITVKAKYSENIQKFTVTFLDHNGVLLKAQSVELGQSATAPENPSRTGYKFDGWNKEFDNITGNLVVTATYTDAILGDWIFQSIHTKDGEILKSGDFIPFDADLGLIPLGEEFLTLSFTGTFVDVSYLKIDLGSFAYTRQKDGTYLINFDTEFLSLESENWILSFTEEGYLKVVHSPDSQEYFIMVEDYAEEKINYLNSLLGDWKFESMFDHYGNLYVGDWYGEGEVGGDDGDGGSFFLTERFLKLSFTENEVEVSILQGSFMVETVTSMYFNFMDEGKYCTTLLVFTGDSGLILYLYPDYDERITVWIYDMETLVPHFCVNLTKGPVEYVNPVAFTVWEWDQMTVPNEQGGNTTLYAGDSSSSEIFNTSLDIRFLDGVGMGVFGLALYSKGNWIGDCGGLWLDNGDGTYTLTCEGEEQLFYQLTALYSEGELILTVDQVNTEFEGMFPVGTTIKFVKCPEPNEEEYNSGEMDAFGLFIRYARMTILDKAEPETIIGDYYNISLNMVFRFFDNGKISGWYNDVPTVGYWINNGDGTYSVEAYYGKSSYGQINDESIADLHFTFQLTEREDEWGNRESYLSIILNDDLYDFYKGTRGFYLEFKWGEWDWQANWKYVDYMDTKINIPENPTKEGYTFMGWKIDGTETIVNFNSNRVPVLSDLKFVAVWRNNSGIEEFTVTFIDYYGNETYQTISEGDYATDPGSTWVEGMVFIGWEIDGLGVIDLSSYPIMSDTTFREFWEVPVIAGTWECEISETVTYTFIFDASGNLSCVVDETGTQYFGTWWSPNDGEYNLTWTTDGIDYYNAFAYIVSETGNLMVSGDTISNEFTKL